MSAILAATSSDSPFAYTFLIFFRLRYSSSHLALYVAMRCSPSDSPNVNSTMGRTCRVWLPISPTYSRSEEHTSELQSLAYLVCRLLLEKKKNIILVYP